ncbi:hypothetical protein KPH14_003496 [Odynerus spinipes]|uniref:RNA (guanine-9-)-methyltransferase domain-containing protein 1 n=1 Tax=Odynerus spinipes TaxID=1348599 RepID=A0AAD9VJU0_9HYME|nr:hypothetical protein KPH14_003496 [Odynerus spinipes]
MHNYGRRCCLIVIRKIRPTVILSSSFSTLIKPSPCSNLQTIFKTEFVKRDFYKSANNYNSVVYQSREEQDAIDNEKLENLLKHNDNEKIYKLLKYELEYLEQLGEEIPKKLRPKDWIYLLKAPTKSQQRKYLRFLFLNEMKERNHKEKKKVTKAESIKEFQEKHELFPSGLTYGLGKNSFFLRFYDKTMDHFLHYNVISSMLFEPKIVFDCSYDDMMAQFEINNCARQLVLSIVLNRTHPTPSHLYLCNAPKNGRLIRKLSHLVPTVLQDNFPLDITAKSYLDIFDKDKLVYLTPHCRTVMKSYDPDKIYIIGALVDKRDPKHFSLAKAKKEGIRMEQLPLDTYLTWGSGRGKSLTLNQVLAILLDIKYTKNWIATLYKNIPPRKLEKTKVEDDHSQIYVKSKNK